MKYRWRSKLDWVFRYLRSVMHGIQENSFLRIQKCIQIFELFYRNHLSVDNKKNGSTPHFFCKVILQKGYVNWPIFFGVMWKASSIPKLKDEIIRVINGIKASNKSKFWQNSKRPRAAKGGLLEDIFRIRISYLIELQIKSFRNFQILFFIRSWKNLLIWNTMYIGLRWKFFAKGSELSVEWFVVMINTT